MTIPTTIIQYNVINKSYAIKSCFQTIYIQRETFFTVCRLKSSGVTNLDKLFTHYNYVVEHVQISLLIFKSVE